MFNYLKPNQCCLKSQEQYAAVRRLAAVRAQRMALAVEEDQLTQYLRSCMFDAREMVDPTFLAQQRRQGVPAAELDQMWVARISEDGHRLEVHPAYASERFRPCEPESAETEDAETAETTLPEAAEEKGENDDEEKRSKKEAEEREAREEPRISPHSSSLSSHDSTLPAPPAVADDSLPLALLNLASIHRTALPAATAQPTPPAPPTARPDATAQSTPAAQPTPPPPAAGADDPNVVPAGREVIYIDKFIQFWNRTVEGTRIPQMQTLQGKRLALLQARTRECGGAAVIEVIHRARSSSFLRGEGSSGWALSIDWLLKPDNFCRIREGVYDDRPSNDRQLAEQQKRQQREANRAIERQMHDDLHASIDQRQRNAASVEQIKAILGDRWMLG